MSDKVKRIPISYRQRDINQHDFGYVPCELTGRYLQFESTYCEDNNLVFVDVMTTSEGTTEPRKLTRLCDNIKFLQDVLSKIQPR